jgi:CRISPR-associated endonuclease Csy4
MFYQEVILLPTIEVNVNFIWKKVYTPLHLAFVEIKNKAGVNLVGVSFPFYNEKDRSCGLGHKLRLFAKDKKTLEFLNTTQVLKNFRDYTFISEIKEVPEGSVAAHTHFRRYHPARLKSNLSRARNLSERYGSSLEKELRDIEKNRPKIYTDLPYLELASGSTGKIYKIFVSKEDIKEQSEGCFTTFGLSQDATVPSF